jgi:hypothetical protein
MHILLTGYSVQLKQTRTDELVNKTQKATSISQDIQRINILNSIIEMQILSLHSRAPEETNWNLRLDIGYPESRISYGSAFTACQVRDGRSIFMRRITLKLYKSNVRF